MAKPSDFYLGVLDFFGVLLPGAATLGGASSLGILRPAVDGFVTNLQSGSRIGAVLVLSYVVGQILNSIGSLVLDFVYDFLYEPGHGALSQGEKPPPGEAIFPWSNHLWDLLRRGVDHGTKARADTLKKEIDELVGNETVKGVYQRVRAYLRVAMPEAFAEVEKLEGEQKFFRTLTVGVTMLAAFAPPGDKPWLAGLAAILFVRYVGIRRRTVERAYVYFSVRACAVALEQHKPPRKPK
jgi:hypothetical protein